MAKITAGMAEAGGTETKQSQEHGVSGLHNAIWREVKLSVSLSMPALHHPGQDSVRGSSSPNTCKQTLREDTSLRLWTFSAPGTPDARCADGDTHCLPKLQARKSAGGRTPCTLRGPCPTESPGLWWDHLPSYQAPLQESHAPFLPTLCGFPNTVSSSPLTPSKNPSLVPGATASV